MTQKAKTSILTTGQQVFLGTVPSSEDTRDYSYTDYAIIDDQEFPIEYFASSIDDDVLDQLKWGSCASHAVTKVREIQQERDTGKYVKYSPVSHYLLRGPAGQEKYMTESIAGVKRWLCSAGMSGRTAASIAIKYGMPCPEDVWEVIKSRSETPGIFEYNKDWTDKDMSDGWQDPFVPLEAWPDGWQELTKDFRTKFYNETNNQVYVQFDLPKRILDSKGWDACQRIKHALMKIGPLLLGVSVYANVEVDRGVWAINPSSNFWAQQGEGVWQGGHAMTIIGWNKKGFIIQNSWGLLPSNDPDLPPGYLLMSYNDFWRMRSNSCPPTGPRNGHMIEVWGLIDNPDPKPPKKIEQAPEQKVKLWVWVLLAVVIGMPLLLLLILGMAQ
ncbi:MAG: hypothetical protein CME70_19505 [Halobacteriovorax sp.]|nr:hypothetical protein [Halobacteriovorax sp.]|tara:strand:+ start:216 stop:1370 length:1155 start_codon:yes stop_codon:yes gene_type:complete